MRSIAAVLILLAPVQDGRTPPPDAAAQKNAEKLVRDVFKDDYARKDPASRRGLAAKLLKQAGETKDDAVARFVLLSEARDIAADAGDVRTALAAAQEQARLYAVEAAAAKRAALDRVRKNASAVDATALAEAYLQVADEALAAEDI